MGITTVWDNAEQTIIRHIYEGAWTWDDFYESIKNAAAMAVTVDHPVDLIIDIRHSTIIPQGMVTHINRLHTNKATWHSRMTVLVGANAFIRALYTAFKGVTERTSKQTGSRFMLVPTLEEAYEVLQQQQEEAQSS